MILRLSRPTPTSVKCSQGDETQAEGKAPLTGIFAFPHGARPGTCLHQIFQELDFSTWTACRTSSAATCARSVFMTLTKTVCAMIRKTVSVPLKIGGSRLYAFPDCRPGAVAGDGILFSDQRGDTGQAGTGVHRTSRTFRPMLFRPTIDRLQFRPMSGFMKGFIDLVFEFEDRFYLVDWKSNWLGPDLDAYASAAIETEMTRRFYTLQLSIYTVALHRFLYARKPGYDYEEHFGGAYYLFLRGIEPTRPEFGVHRMKLPADFVHRLSTVFTP